MKEQVRSPTDEILGTNLLPAAVPFTMDLPPVVITEQPGLSINKSYVIPKVIIEAPSTKRESHHYNRKDHHTFNPSALACLAVADTLLIEINKNYFSCFWDVRYSIKDVTSGESEIFTATEELACCNLGNLRNVVFRDTENLPVARTCFKEKHCLLSSLVLAVYAPPELLIGSAEESPRCFMLSTEFLLRNSNGDEIFRVDYNGGLCSSYFTVMALESNEEIAKILEKTKYKIRIQFLTKLNITHKLILVGFTIGMISKNMQQQKSFIL